MPEMSEKGKAIPTNPALYQFKLLRPPRPLEPRPLSVETIFVDSDDEILSSDDEEESNSPRNSIKSVSHSRGPSKTYSTHQHFY